MNMLSIELLGQVHSRSVNPGNYSVTELLEVMND